MAIDTTVPLSPGWWIARLSRKMQLRNRRIYRLDLYLRGVPPIYGVAEHRKAVYQEFLRKARSNFAELVVEAVRERMSISGFRTAAETELSGDDNAWSIWKANGLDIESSEVHQHMLGFGDAYVIVGYDDATKKPIITGEDPRQVITEHDPMRPQEVIAALKLFHDDVNDVDLAFLYLPGIVYTAARRRRATLRPDGSSAAATFSATAWDWVDSELATISETVGLLPNEFDDLVGQTLPATAANVVPVVPFPNRHHEGEFERHIDLLDRINHMILQRMIIATFQAFKQRAVKGTFPETDEVGNPIDYDQIFSADPGAVWQIPVDAEMWESGQVDLGPILNSVKADVEHLASVTRTPMYYLTPGETSQSAEGASLSREGLVFKTSDRIIRANVGWTKVMYLAFLFSGDTERANLSELQPIWAPVERFSLTEMASASAQAITALPWETLMERVWQLSPEELARAKTQRSADMVVAQQALALAAVKGQAPPVTEPTNDGS